MSVARPALRNCSHLQCKEAIATATFLGEKEAATYANFSGYYKANTGSMRKAIAAIEHGAGGFLETSSVQIMKKLSIEMELRSAERDQIVSFFSNSQGSEAHRTS